jgi:hypothetical protein
LTYVLNQLNSDGAGIQAAMATQVRMTAECISTPAAVVAVAQQQRCTSAVHFDQTDVRVSHAPAAVNPCLPVLTLHIRSQLQSAPASNWVLAGMTIQATFIP